MTAQATPRMRAAARRFRSPVDPIRAAKLEPVHQPLYSTFVFDAATAPNVALFFQYAVGNPVATNVAAGAGAATLLHTNMQAAGQLAQPKMFLTTGIRVVPIELTSGFTTLLEDTAGYTVAGPTYTGNDDPVLEDLLRITYGSFLRFFVGSKDYVVAPTWNFPANTGVQGESSNIFIGGATPTAPVTLQNFHTWHSAGRYYSMPAFPTMLVPLQSFTVSLEFPQTSRPAIGTARAVQIMLDGILGREVQ